MPVSRLHNGVRSSCEKLKGISILTSLNIKVMGKKACALYSSRKVCSHIVAVAQHTESMGGYLQWLLKQLHKSANVSALADVGMPKGCGKKPKSHRKSSQKSSTKCTKLMLSQAESEELAHRIKPKSCAHAPLIKSTVCRNAPPKKSSCDQRSHSSSQTHYSARASLGPVSQPSHSPSNSATALHSATASLDPVHQLLLPTWPEHHPVMSASHQVLLPTQQSIIWSCQTAIKPPFLLTQSTSQSCQFSISLLFTGPRQGAITNFLSCQNVTRSCQSAVSPWPFISNFPHCPWPWQEVLTPYHSSARTLPDQTVTPISISSHRILRHTWMNHPISHLCWNVCTAQYFILSFANFMPQQ